MALNQLIPVKDYVIVFIAPFCIELINSQSQTS